MAWLILLLIFIAGPFLTHYVTTILFNQGSAGKNSSRTPPTIPYWIPGLFHALGLLSKPSTYFALLIKNYGGHTPFFVKIGRASYLVVRSPEQCRYLLPTDGSKATYELVEVYSKVFGATRDIIKCYDSVDAGDSEGDFAHLAHTSLLRKYMEDAELKYFTDLFVSVFQRNMSNKMFQTSTWTQIEDLWSFLEIEITRATVETIFGSAFVKQYPKLVRDFWDFNSKMSEFLPGLPGFTISSSVPPRDRLLEAIKKWLQATHGGTDFAQIKDTDPFWDAKRGSKFIQERDAMFARSPSFNYQMRASECFRVMHNVTSATMPSTFWHTLEILRNRALANFLSSEIRQHTHSNNIQYDIAAITQLPNMQSLTAEVKRLRTATYMAHTAEHADTQLPASDGGSSGGGKWNVPKGTTLLAFSQDIGLNTALWSQARPHTTTRPLTEFWPERFLVPDKSASTKRYRKGRDSVTTGTFTLTGLEALHAVLGNDGNASKLERALADAFQTAAVAVLLAEFDMEICEPEGLEEVLPVPGEVAFGVLKPLAGVAVRLKVRAGSPIAPS